MSYICTLEIVNSMDMASHRKIGRVSRLLLLTLLSAQGSRLKVLGSRSSAQGPSAQGPQHKILWLKVLG